MSSTQLPLPAGPRHRNQQLFSDYYLDHLLPARGDWQMLAAAAEAGAARARIAAIFAGFTPSKVEAQTEHELVRPILAALGHTFEVQAPLATAQGTKKPDYILYRDLAALNANKGAILDEACLAAGGLAAGEAKYWDRPLDIALRDAQRVGDPFDNRNPSYQIAFYMLHSGVPWGILTNGRLWRLYHRDTAHKLDRYYEVDLLALLASEDPGAFLYFYVFFRRAAFDPGPLALTALLQASRDYAAGVGETLKAQVYEALRHLAQGFLDHPDNRLAPDAETLGLIYSNALILLYRLLFVFYAEARGLLPVGESELYRGRYSLYAIARDVARDLRSGVHLLPSSATLWPRLRELFRIIDAGSPPLKVATFNGGLFDPGKHAFLEAHTVGDAHLQQAIDRLARVEGQFIDYRDLAERHLGTIYEGLLEYHLILAPLPSPERTAAQERGGGRGWGEEVVLVNDKGERHATGSYYTPDYIVKYIVEQAVGPALAAAVAGKRDDRAKIAAVLDVNVLDPAMGSGHFLVEATEYIARFLVDLGVAPVEGSRSKVEGSAAPSLQPATLNLSPETDLAYWKRRVAQSCIYGVDLNPLAVDLAKLSLWLITAAKDRPLSFLDHHLRPGNSLAGARLADLTDARNQVSRRNLVSSAARKARQAEAAGQIGLFTDDDFRQSMSLAVGSLWLIEANPAEEVAQVKEQEHLYAELRRSFTEHYARLADLATANRFGLGVDAALWGPLAEYAAKRGLAAFPKFDAWLAQAADLARRHRFFHWELEFPEVFFDRHGGPLGDRAGFDAVIGNPPYVRQELLKPSKPFFESTFASFHSTTDLYLYFYEQGLRLLQESGRLAYISSGTFARGNFAVPFRKWLPAQAQLETIIDFGENQPVPGAEMVRPSIVVLRKTPQAEAFRSLFIADKVPSNLRQAVDVDGVDCDSDALQQPEWSFQPAASTRLLNRLLGAGQKLADVLEGRLYLGVKTGLNEAFIVDQVTRDRILQISPNAGEIIKRSVRGEDLRPWYQENEGRYMIVLPAGWTRAQLGDKPTEADAWRWLNDSYPGVAQHLNPFVEAARKRQDVGDYWWELRACDYYDAFDAPKVFWPDIAKLPRFSWDESGTYMNNTGYMAVTDDPTVLGILQSRVTWFAISQIAQPLRLRAGLWQFRLFPQFLGRLPIPDAPAADRDAIGGLALRITAQARARYDLHRQARHRILSDLGAAGRGGVIPPLNQKLAAWWELDFPAFRGEVQKVYRQDIPLRERDAWEAWLGERRAEHEQLTAQIVAMETDLNRRVYTLFDLSAAEVKIIEASTKYRYGEV